jgi:hypothetical protein
MNVCFAAHLALTRHLQTAQSQRCVSSAALAPIRQRQTEPSPSQQAVVERGFDENLQQGAGVVYSGLHLPVA